MVARKTSKARSLTNALRNADRQSARQIMNHDTVFNEFFCNGPLAVNPQFAGPVAGVSLLSGGGAWPPPDGV